MKKAILVVSFGTAYADARKLTLDRIEERVKENFKDYEIRRAFTSHIIIKILNKRDGIKINTIEEAFEKLIQEEFEEVIVQPLYIIPGEEFEYVLRVVDGYKNFFQSIKVGRPVLFFQGGEGLLDDYKIFIEVVEKIIPMQGLTIFMGHGSVHLGNDCYFYLQGLLQHKGYTKIYIANLEGTPNIEDIIAKIRSEQVGEKYVTLIPLLIAAGGHVKNDMAGSQESSWKNILLREGFNVHLYLHGLGEITEFQDIYLNHIENAIDNRYEDRSVEATNKIVKKEVKVGS